LSELSRRLTIARRDLGGLSREKTIVLALLIQLFIAAFSSFLVVGLSTLADPGTAESGQTVEAAVTGNASDEVIAAAREVEGLRLRAYDDRADAMARFDGREVAAVIDADHVDDRISVEVTAARGVQTTVVVVRVREALEALERAEREQRSYAERVLPLPPESGASPYFGFTYTILVPLLLFLPAFISGSLAVDSVTEEIERGTMELLRATPASMVAIVDGKAAAMAVLAPAQATVWVVLLGLNGIRVANPLALVALVAAFATLLTAVGMVVGLATATRQQAQLLYSMGVLVAFGAAALLPEHPATTAALLAIDSATTTTYLLLAGYLVVAALGYAGARAVTRRIDPETL
jgi:ABC-type Na+ efflux pump permease subunit